MSDILSTSYITSLVNSYMQTETTKSITPLLSRKTKYSNLSTAYGTLSTKLDTLKSFLSDFKMTGSSSAFASKLANSTDSNFITATADSTAVDGMYNLRVNQLAKSDTLISSNFTSGDSNAITGTHSFVIKTGDGEGGQFYSTVNVDFEAGETNKTAMQKIRDAINADKAVVTSDSKQASTAYAGGAATFKINLDGTETEISVDGGGTYEQLIDEVVGKISDKISGVTAEKVVDSSTGDVSLKLTVNDSSKYISISNVSGFDLVGDLNIAVNKEKGASGLVNASVFSADTTTSQLSLNAKQTGLDYRIEEISDASGSSALSSIGLNIGTARPTFDQTQSPDTAGFLYADITSNNNLLNSKLSFNGLQIQRNSNSIDDLVDGVTLNLKNLSKTDDPDVNINVSTDVDSIKSKIQNFITKFNDVYTNIKNQSLIVSGTRGLFMGDSNTSSIMNIMKDTVLSPISGIASGDLSLLTQIGIKFDPATGLSISDDEELTTKIKENTSQVEAIFNSTNGIANTLYNKLNGYTGTNGYISSTITSFDNNVQYYDDRVTAAKTRLNNSSEVLRSKYEQLQSQLATLLNTQSFINFIIWMIILQKAASDIILNYREIIKYFRYSFRR